MLWQPTRGILQPNQSWRRGQGAPAGGGFPSLSGTVLARYTAKTGVSLSGSNVTGWADQSASGANLVTGGSVPTYSATGFNGAYPGITVNGTYLRTTADAIATGGTVGMSFWMVYRPISGAVNNRVLNAIVKGYVNLLDYAGTTHAIPFLRTATGLQGMAGGTGNSNMAVTDGTNNRVGMVFDGTNTISYKNGVQQASTAYVYPTGWGKPGVNLLTLGLSTYLENDASGNATFAQAGAFATNCTYAEIVMMAGAATSGDLSAMDSYFQSEWGL